MQAAANGTSTQQQQQQQQQQVGYGLKQQQLQQQQQNFQQKHFQQQQMVNHQQQRGVSAGNSMKKSPAMGPEPGAFGGSRQFSGSQSVGARTAVAGTFSHGGSATSTAASSPSSVHGRVRGMIGMGGGSGIGWQMSRNGPGLKPGFTQHPHMVGLPYPHPPHMMGGGTPYAPPPGMVPVNSFGQPMFVHPGMPGQRHAIPVLLPPSQASGARSIKGSERNLMAVLNGETAHQGNDVGEGSSAAGSSSSKRKRVESDDEDADDADDESEEDDDSKGKNKGKGKGKNKRKIKGKGKGKPKVRGKLADKLKAKRYREGKGKVQRARPIFRHGNGVDPGWRKIQEQKKVYRPYLEAQAFVASLRLNSPNEWRHYCRTGRKPWDIPSRPEGVYLHRGWTTFAAWLGVEPPPLPPGTKTFAKARGYARALMLKDKEEWNRFVEGKNCPDSLPKEPWVTYALHGWRGLSDFLGTKKVPKSKRIFWPFHKSRDYCRSLGLKTIREWHIWVKSADRPKEVPAYPERVYAKRGFKGMHDWLGTNSFICGTRKYRTFMEARDFARKLGLHSEDQWDEYVKTHCIPADIPSNPRRVYRGRGWKGFKNFLGIEVIRERPILFGKPNILGTTKEKEKVIESSKKVTGAYYTFATVRNVMQKLVEETCRLNGEALPEKWKPGANMKMKCARWGAEERERQRAAPSFRVAEKRARMLPLHEQRPYWAKYWAKLERQWREQDEKEERKRFLLIQQRRQLVETIKQTTAKLPQKPPHANAASLEERMTLTLESGDSGDDSDVEDGYPSDWCETCDRYYLDVDDMSSAEELDSE